MKITLGNKIINEKYAAEAYRQCWDYLLEKNLISDIVLNDFPLLVKKDKNDWKPEQKKDSYLVNNSGNLWITTHFSSNDIHRNLLNIFAKYGIDGKVTKDLLTSEDEQSLNESELNQEDMTNSNIVNLNIKYFKISVDSLITTFSRIESGKEINFNVKTEQTLPNDLSINDTIIASVNDKVYYNLIVKEINGDLIKLYKTFEIAKSIDLYIETIGVFEQIDKKEYEAICTKLFSDFKTDQSPETTKVELGNIKEEFANWLFNLGKYSRVYKGDRVILVEKLNEFENAYNTDFGILIFGYPGVSIDKIIEALETNIIDDAGEIGDLNRRTVGNGSVKAILGPNNYIKFLKELLLKSKTSKAKSPKVDPVNKIYFGAPGTGKSYQITQDLKDVDLIFQKRVTFHPEYDNASFIGGYKPVTDTNGDIKYEFVPQIFTNIYVEACNDPSHQYYLIIEEINRGNCAEIFGELFQLLDRNKDYKITPSNELINYLNSNISNSEFYKDGKMLLPDNLSVLATMNTSDQSLFPMDSAFKRRWEWEYIPINYSKDSNKNKSASFKIKIGNELIDWIAFIESINKKIQSNKNLGMDKCIGNYFIEPNTSNNITLDKFIYKVLFYLWNDVFKDEPRDSIFGDKSYQDFFPIETEGEQLVIKILEDLKITNPKLPVGETKPED